MFGKKKKEKKETLPQEVEKQKKEEMSVFGKGKRTERELLAPSFIDRTDPKFLQVGNNFVKSFIIEGYPSQVYVEWLDALYNYEGDADVAFYVEPADDRIAIDELTKKITQFESQLMIEQKQGNTKNITRMQAEISKLYNQRIALEQNRDSLFYVQVFFNLYAKSEEELEKKTEMLLSTMRGKKIKLTSLDLRQSDGYKSGLPFGKVYIDDLYRNFSSGGVKASFPYYNAEISHKNGIFVGINSMTNTPIYLDLFNSDVLNNANFTVFGASGSGKTYFVSLFIMRNILKGIKSIIIDPEGEYVNITKNLGGEHIYISMDSDTHINMFDIEEADEIASDGSFTGRKTVDIKEKVGDLLNLMGVMSRGMTAEQEGLVTVVLQELYNRFGITEDPRSLYEAGSNYDPETGTIMTTGVKKRMPQFTDFHDLLIEYSEKPNFRALKPLINALVMFRQEEAYGYFDCQTSKGIDFNNKPLVVFDVSRLEESILRPIGMYIVSTLTWDKIIKKNKEIKKLLLVDEAWMLVNPNMSGSEYTAGFLEKAARRIRKRNAGLGIISQSFQEFEEHPLGRAVLVNAGTNIFLKQKPDMAQKIQNVFGLSDGERNFIANARQGQILVKLDGGKSGRADSTAAQVFSFNYEHNLIVGGNLK